MNFVPKIVVFHCENSGSLALERAKELNLPLESNLKFVKLPCSGKVDLIYILKAMEKGADGVLILVCQKENCKFLSGNSIASRHVTSAQKALAEIGVEQSRIALAHLSANNYQKLIEELQEIEELLQELGPNPGKVISK